jgi:Flp pilus assembly protein TadG
MKKTNRTHEPASLGGRIRSERGQMLALLAVSAVGLIGMGSLVLDVGAAMRQHRKAQSAADGSALAAAQYLPTSTSSASTASSQVASKNLPDGSVSISYSATYTSNDTASTTAATTSPTFLAKVFGSKFSIFNETATAKAVAGSYTGWSKGMSPWVTDEGGLLWGQSLTFKVKPGNQASSGNFGGARLPVSQNSCALASGGSDYRNLIGGSLTSCTVNIGGFLDPETGNLAGPTPQGLSDRGVIQNFDPYSILTQQANGEYVLTTYDHPNLIVIPVIEQFYPGTSKPFKVLGFAWFIITSYSGTTVTGMFISSRAPGGAQCKSASGSTSCPIGAWNQYGFKVIQLIG